MPKYKIYTSRYANGEYVFADVEHPATIEVPVGHKIDRRLFPTCEKGLAEKKKYQNYKAKLFEERVDEPEPGTVKPTFAAKKVGPDIELPETAGVAVKTEPGKRVADSDI